MINSDQTYKKPNRFIAAVLTVVSVGIISLQTGWAYAATASSVSTPITSPITSEESPAPSATPSVTPSPSASESATPSATPTPTPTPTPSSSPYLKITYPNGGENFNVGEFVRIGWEQDGLENYNCLVSYESPVSTYPHLFTANPVQRYFNWIVDISGLAQGSSTQVKIDMSCYDNDGHNGVFDKSDDSFTVNYLNPSVAPSATPTPTPSAEPSVEPSPSASPEASSSASVAPSATPAASSQPSSNNNSNNGGGSSNGGSVGAPSCNNAAPASAPKIISAVSTGANEVTLTWDKAQNPVTHYVIAYGLTAGQPLYGNPNVGNVTSYTVKGLSGNTTYFFQVRAGNDCQPGKYSEETAVKVGGVLINKPAQNFVPGVLGQTTVSPTPSATPSASASVAPESGTNISDGGIIGKIINFFKNLFNGS